MFLPLFWFSLAFLLGIILGGAVFLPVSVWLFLAGTALVLGLLWRFLTHSLDLTSLSKDILSSTAFLVILFLGAARYQTAVPSFDAFDLGWYNDRDYDTLVTAWVTEPPDRRDNYANLRVRATGIDTGDGTDLKVDGLLLARVDPNDEYQYGEIIRLRGRLKTPAENEEFSYRDYLARQGVYSTMSSADVTVLPGKEGNIFTAGLYALKSYALETIYHLFPDPEASLLAGILLGVDNGLPKDLQQAFKDTGTAHIIAISGFNISIIAELFLAVFGRAFGKRRGAFFAGLGIIFYTLLVGADAAVVRAAVMGVAALLARHFGRTQDGLNTLFGVGALMALFNPHYLQDVGFQLSFFATLGLILYSQPLEALATRFLSTFNLQSSTVEKTSSFITNFFLLTLAAQVTTLPIMAYHFNRLSLVSFIANPFILPAQPAVMILGGLADILGMIFRPLGQLAAFVAWPFVAYTIRVVDFFAGLPGAAISVDFPLWAVIVWYVALLGLTVGREPFKEFFVSLKTRLPKIPVWAALTVLTLLAILVWRGVLSLPDGKLHITFLNVGTSDAILIQTPNGDNVLINGGESLSQLSSQLGQRLPLFNRKLDWLIVASTRENQVNALPRLVDRYPPAQVLWAGNVEASYPSRSLNAWLTSHQVRVTRAEEDQVLDLGDGAVLHVVFVDERGAVLLVEYGSFRALLPVGMGFDALDKLVTDDSLPPLTALLLADSGFAPLNTSGWIDFLDPQLVLLSVSADNPDGLPNAATLEAVEGRALLRTDVNGWIEIASDGQSIWVEVERGDLTPTPAPMEEPTPTEEPFATEEPFPTEFPATTETP
ncbi:MAG: ComEC/Rec2 family competence protein [Anaerolineaceae bacterium]|nr:MAG: ComEC/Rec2 family competence protein [Anaerolineaceae bacterium]